MLNLCVRTLLFRFRVWKPAFIIFHQHYFNVLRIVGAQAGACRRVLMSDVESGFIAVFEVADSLTTYYYDARTAC